MIRVIIERCFCDGMNSELIAIEKVARKEAQRYSGYLSGESLRNISDPLHNIVISNWSSMEDWEAWYSSPARNRLVGQLAPILDKPEKITIFEQI